MSDDIRPLTRKEVFALVERKESFRSVDAFGRAEDNREYVLYATISRGTCNRWIVLNRDGMWYGRKRTNDEAAELPELNLWCELFEPLVHCWVPSVALWDAAFKVDPPGIVELLRHSP